MKKVPHSYTNVIVTIREINRIIAQRDKLLAALKAYDSCVEGYSTVVIVTKEIIEAGYEAIKEVEAS